MAKASDEKEKRIPDALRNFDQLPDSANVGFDIAAALCGVSVTTAWRMARNGHLPKPKRISPRRTVFNVGELRAHLATL